MMLKCFRRSRGKNKSTFNSYDDIDVVDGEMAVHLSYKKAHEGEILPRRKRRKKKTTSRKTIDCEIRRRRKSRNGNEVED